jgi:hypothetical protein
MAYAGLSVVLHLAAWFNRITTLPDQIFVQLSKALSILDLQLTSHLGVDFI